MRRRPDTLLPLEAEIIAQLVASAGRGAGGEHGFALAHRIAQVEGARRLTAHGTLYKALARLERTGLVASRWEDADIALAAGRPRRRLYAVTADGEKALASMARTTSTAAFHPDRALPT